MFSSEELIQFEQTLKRERKVFQKEIQFFLNHSNLASHKKLSDFLSTIPESKWVETLWSQACEEIKPIVVKLDKVEASLSQIEMGLFGLCADCEAEIPKELLYKNPSHQRCPLCFDKHQKKHAN